MKPRYFNCNIHEYITKDCQKPKKEKKTRKYYKYDKIEHLAKDYRTVEDKEQECTRGLR